MILDKRGFTLVEIMVTVAIIAVLAAIAVPNLLRARIDAHDSMAQNTLKSLSTAMETYASAQFQYPNTPTDLVTATPQYISVDYFTGIHAGFTYASALTPDTYVLHAIPVSSNLGSRSFTISTGGTLTAN